MLGQAKNGNTDAGVRIDQLLRGKRHPQPLLFLPYLRGERVPYWDASLRGAFVGLSRDHTATDLAYAVLEGVASSIASCLNAPSRRRAQPSPRSALAVVARLMRSWCQIKADICERPVIVGRSAEPGLTGAAVIAFTGLGRFASLQDAQAQLVQAAHRYEPNVARAAAYRELFGLFRQAEIALAPVSHGLVDLAVRAAALVPSDPTK